MKGNAKKGTELMATPKKARTDQKQTKRDQQGAKGRLVSDPSVDPGGQQAAKIGALGAVAAGHPRPEPVADERQAAHPRPADGDEVELSIGPRGSAHDPAASRIAATTSAATRWLCPMPSRIVLPPPNFTSSP